jgi:glycyl-tRNA synthetase beta chain
MAPSRAPSGKSADLLFEIGTEELPPKALATLSHALGNGIAKGLADHSLVFKGEVRCFATPRRLGVLVESLSLMQPDTVVERRGPPLNKAFDDDGRPTRAAVGFAQTCGVEVAQLERLETDRGAWLTYRQAQPGRSTGELLPAILSRALEDLPVPKRMRWNALQIEFVRPVHWAVVLLGADVVDCEVLGVRAGRDTRGHRFHHPAPLSLHTPSEYPSLLAAEGRVIPQFAARRETIQTQVAAAAAGVGGRAVMDDALLDEVTGLVEWPVALVGGFDGRFLEVAQEAVISAMQVHQKSFPVVDGSGRLMPYFIAVSNIDSRDAAVVRAGFERVIRPRLSDADFFWRQDRRHPLSSHLERLAGVVFQDRLGSLLDKSRRLAELSTATAASCGADPGTARRAAELSKCDLVTRMVEEFPELQGIMGRYYAINDGETADVAHAIAAHYLPRFAGDDLPAGAAGRAVALADRIDTLVGVFAIGQAPTGDKDPFALRRAALGIIRILVEQGIDADLRALLDRAADIYNRQTRGLVGSDVLPQVMDFILGRLRVYYTGQGFGHDEINAVLNPDSSQPTDIDKRLRALAVFRKLPEADSLAAANKRIKNILRQANVTVAGAVDPDLLRDAEERELFERINGLSAEVAPLLRDRDYEQALKALARLREPVDNFFDRVMVMVDDADVRTNRLALLQALMDLFTKIADVSALQ